MPQLLAVIMRQWAEGPFICYLHTTEFRQQSTKGGRAKRLRCYSEWHTRLHSLRNFQLECVRVCPCPRLTAVTDSSETAGVGEKRGRYWGKVCQKRKGGHLDGCECYTVSVDITARQKEESLRLFLLVIKKIPLWYNTMKSETRDQ